ncbi:MAG: GAF domain-containing protein [Elusimicrobia bacterium]|nr:GAF domain-containing protein [Elusimicrobiota bacterium]
MNEPNPNVPPDRPRRHGYEKVLQAVENRWKRRVVDRVRLMQQIVDLLWEAFGGGAYSWCGFYLPGPSGGDLVLGACRDKPACSPIASHGVCGRALGMAATQIVPDVQALGEAHIECDPKNRSEIAVPVFGPDGKPFAVLDVDSYAPAAFDEVDQRWLERIVRVLEGSAGPKADA